MPGNPSVLMGKVKVKKIPNALVPAVVLSVNGKASNHCVSSLEGKCKTSHADIE